LGGDAIIIQHGPVDVTTGEVSIGLEHVSSEGAPHHEFDDAFIDAVLNEVGDTGMPEDVRGDMFGDAGTASNLLDLTVYSRMIQRISLLGEKYKCVRFRGERIIIFPSGDMFCRHDEADISRFAGFEIDIDDNAVLIEFHIIPDECPQFSDAKATFIEHGDNRPVPAVLAAPYHSGDFFFGEDVVRLFGHGLL